jgi:hypothetical protein
VGVDLTTHNSSGGDDTTRPRRQAVSHSFVCPCAMYVVLDPGCLSHSEKKLLSPSDWARTKIRGLMKSRLIGTLSCDLHQGCQIFLGAWYQNRKKMYQINPKYAKWSQNFPNVSKIFQMVIKYFNIFQPKALKNYPDWDFWFENKPSGNPDLHWRVIKRLLTFFHSIRKLSHIHRKCVDRFFPKKIFPNIIILVKCT